MDASIVFVDILGIVFFTVHTWYQRDFGSIVKASFRKQGFLGNSESMEGLDATHIRDATHLWYMETYILPYHHRLVAGVGCLPEKP